MVRAGGTHHCLMVIVGQRISRSETLEERSVAGRDVDEPHRRAAPTPMFAALGGREGGRCDEWIEVAQAAGGVAVRGMPDVAIRLLPHLKKNGAACPGYRHR